MYKLLKKLCWNINTHTQFLVFIQKIFQPRPCGVMPAPLTATISWPPRHDSSQAISQSLSEMCWMPIQLFRTLEIEKRSGSAWQQPQGKVFPCPACHFPVFRQAIHSTTPPLSNEENWRLWALFKYFVAWIMYKIFICLTPAWVSAFEIASSERNNLLEVQEVQVGLVVLVAQAFPTGMFGFLVFFFKKVLKYLY